MLVLRHVSDTPPGTASSVPCSIAELTLHSPTGDFLIAHHPKYKSLFLATGGSGHGFKFFPVIGDKIVATIEGSVEPQLAHIWRWRSEDEVREALGGKEFVGCADGSRSGRMGMILSEEMARKGVGRARL
jgi:sarcosine oxidase / L-pipecolate oxidase